MQDIVKNVVTGFEKFSETTHVSCIVFALNALKFLSNLSAFTAKICKKNWTDLSKLSTLVTDYLTYFCQNS